MPRRGNDLIALSADVIFPLINCGSQKRSAQTLCMVFQFSRVADDTSPISLPKNSALCSQFRLGRTLGTEGNRLRRAPAREEIHQRLEVRHQVNLGTAIP